MTADETEIRSTVQRHLGQDVKIILLDPPELFQAIGAACEKDNHDPIIVGGGDGTISASARLAFENEKTIGVLPLGTINLLARALGMPLQLESALEELASADVASVDVGIVNGKPFFNHVSVGLHPRLIRLRDQQDYSGQLSKITSGIKTFARALDGHTPRVLSVQSSSDIVELPSTGIAVTVNPVPEKPLQLPFRRGQQHGHLGCYILPELETSQIVKLAHDLIIGHWSTAENMQFLESSSFTIDGNGPMHVSVDGEVELHEGPLHCAILPGSLKVLFPKPGNNES